MKQAIAYTFDGVTSCQWLSDDEARIIQQNEGIPAGEAREYFLGGELLFKSIGDALNSLFERDLIAKPADPNAMSVTPSPVGAAREIAFSGPVTIAFENALLGGLSAEEIVLRSIGEQLSEAMFCANVEPDPNAAMIARDEPKFATGGYVDKNHYHRVRVDESWNYSRVFGPVVSVWSSDGGVSFSLQKPGVKPAITGLTTVHDGKVNGLGFCSDLGHE